MRSHDSRSVLRFAVHRGFKLLAAMGYKQGQKIGKSGSGLAEPLPLLLKQARPQECVRVGRQTHCLMVSRHLHLCCPQHAAHQAS